MIRIDIGIYKRFSWEHIDTWNYNNTLDINIKFKLIPNLSFEIKKNTRKRFSKECGWSDTVILVNTQLNKSKLLIGE